MASSGWLEFSDSAFLLRALGLRVRGLSRLPKIPAGGEVTLSELATVVSLSLLFCARNCGFSVRATEKGGNSVVASNLSLSSFLVKLSDSFLVVLSVSFFNVASGLGFRLRNGRLLPTLKLNLGLNVVTLNVDVVGTVVVGVGVVSAGVMVVDLDPDPSLEKVGISSFFWVVSDNRGRWVKEKLGMRGRGLGTEDSWVWKLRFSSSTPRAP